ncbi:ArnT family glycosyltransferase [Engelhardtia mirabilis]
MIWSVALASLVALAFAVALGRLAQRRLAVDSDASQVSGRPVARTLTFLLLLAGATLPCLYGWSLLDRDEGYYAESARSMLERHDLFVPVVAGEAWLEKPPLTFWAMMASIGSLGRTEFAARLPAALFGLLAIGLTVALARRMVSARAAWLAGFALATSLLPALAMRIALLDASLLACVVLAMTGLWESIDGRERRGWWLFALGTGLGVIAKGPLGAALPIFALVGYVVASRDFGLLRRMRPLASAALALAVVALWAVPATIQTDGAYLHELVWVRTIQPIFSPLQGHGGGNTLAYLALLPVYLPIVWLGLGVWAPFLVPALRARGQDERARRRRQFLLGWVVSMLVAFSLVSTKLAHYVLPFFPALAILIGVWIDGALERGERLWTGWRSNYLLGGGLFSAAVIIAGPSLLGAPIATWAFLAPGAVAALGAFLVHRAARAGRDVPALAGAGTLVLATLALLTPFALGRLDAGKSPQAIAELLRERYADRLDSLQIGLSDYSQFALLYYLDSPNTSKVQATQITAFFDGPDPAVVVIPRRTLDEALETTTLPEGAEVLWERRCWIEDKNRWREVVVLGNGR